MSRDDSAFATGPSAVPTSSVAADSDTPLHVLILDIAAEDRRALRRALSSWHCVVREADTASRGLAAAAAQHPDCLLLDDRLSDLDAAAVLAGLRRPDGTLSSAVVVVARTPETAAAATWLRAGAHDSVAHATLDPVLLWKTVRGAVTSHRQILARRWQQLRHAQLAAVIEATSDAIVSVDNEDRVTSWNPGAVSLFGYSEAEALGRSIDALIVPPDTVAVRQALYRDVRAGGAALRVETERRHKDGHRLTVEVNVSPMFDAVGSVLGICVIFHDLTERKQAEQRLRDSERRQTFLLALSDSLRQLSDPDVIHAETSRRLGEELGVARVAFYQIDGTDYVISSNFTRGVAPLTARYPVAAYGADLLSQQHRGAPIVVADVAAVHTAAEVERFAALDIAAYLNVPYVKNGRLLIGMTAHAARPRAWTPAEVSLVREAAERAWGASERARTEAALRAAHDTFRHLIEQSPFGIYLVDADFRLAQVSAGAQKVFATVRPLIGRDFAEVLRVLWPEPFVSEAIGHFRHTLATGEAYHAANTVEERADIHVQEAYDWKIERLVLPDGRYGVVCHFYDLSERQRHEEHVRLLMDEINHRSKNLLGVIQAIARATATAGPEEFFKSFSLRLQSLAANQDVLVSNDWRAVPLADLVRAQLLHFDTARQNRVLVEGPPLNITAAAGQALSMALHELATNAAKYGALANASGRVSITWGTHAEDLGAARFFMCWTESGGPPVTPPRRFGFGSTVIDRMTRMRLDCEANIDYAPSGLVWRIDCPLSNLIESRLPPSLWSQRSQE